MSGGWRDETLARMRTLIMQADPAIIEESKWGGVPTFSHDGIVCTGETYTKVVKLTFAHGASLPDPSRLFNASLAGNTRRAIDIREGEKIDARAFKALVKAAVARNVEARTARPVKKAKPSASKTATKTATKTDTKTDTTAATKPVKLLSGGNPQIAKGDGDAPVQAYIAAMPEWKRDIGERLDALIVKSVPTVRKAVKWNSPFYGLEGKGWFLVFHTFTRYVRITFFNGMSLKPTPPVASKMKDVRYLDIHEGEFDEARIARWVKQAAKLPGWEP